jgi:hypothetical protein
MLPVFPGERRHHLAPNGRLIMCTASPKPSFCSTHSPRGCGSYKEPPGAKARIGGDSGSPLALSDTIVLYAFRHDQRLRLIVKHKAEQAVVACRCCDP